MAAKAARAAAPPKWETPPVHPAAEMLPMMSDAELDELAADIKVNGLQHPIILFRDNTAAMNGSDGPFPLYLLDGRNRLKALQRLGIDDPRQAPGGRIVDSRVRTLNALQEGALIGGKTTRVTWTPNVDPQEFVTSMNVYRRHLTQTQKRAHIAALIKADPAASDRKIARKAGADHKTVADVRSKPSLNGEIPQKETPVDRVKCVLRDDPTMTLAAAQRAAGVGWSTVYKARDELVAAGEIPAEKPTPKSPPSPAPVKKRKPAEEAGRKDTARQVAIQETVTLIAELTKVVTGFKKHAFTESDVHIIGEQRQALRGIIAELNAVKTAESKQSK